MQSYRQDKKLVSIDFDHNPELIRITFLTGDVRFHGTTVKPDSRIPSALDRVFSLLQESKDKVAGRSILELDLSRLNIFDEHIVNLIALLQKLSVYQRENTQLSFRLLFESNDCLTDKGICLLLKNLKDFPENLQITLSGSNIASNKTLQTLSDLISKGEAKKGLNVSFSNSFLGGISDDGLIALANGLEKGRAPENFSISFWCNEIKTCASADAIAKVVARGKAPKGFGFAIGYTLSNSKEDLGKVTLSFADAIKTGNAPEGFSLKLFFTELKLSYFKKFMDVLCDGKVPESFDFDIGGLISMNTKDYVDQICHFLESGRVPSNCRIGLQRREIGDEGFIRIIQSIKKGVRKGNQLQGLQLILGDIGNPPANNPITDKGINALADLIKENLFPRNFFIDLSGNIITNTGAHKLLDALNNQRSLKGLNILFNNMQPLAVDYAKIYVDDEILTKITQRLKDAELSEVAFAYLLFVRHFSTRSIKLPLDVMQEIISYAFPFKTTLKLTDEGKQLFLPDIFAKNIMIKTKELEDIKYLSSGKAPRNFHIVFPHINDVGVAYLALAIGRGEKVGNKLEGLIINLVSNKLITDDGFSTFVALILKKAIPYRCIIDLRHTNLTDKSADMILDALNEHGFFNDFQILLDGTKISPTNIAKINDFIEAHRKINQAAVLCFTAYNRGKSPLKEYYLPPEILLNIFQFVFPYADKLNSNNQSTHLTFFKNVMTSPRLPSNDPKLDDKQKCIIS